MLYLWVCHERLSNNQTNQIPHHFNAYFLRLTSVNVTSGLCSLLTPWESYFWTAVNGHCSDVRVRQSGIVYSVVDLRRGWNSDNFSVTSPALQSAPEWHISVPSGSSRTMRTLLPLSNPFNSWRRGGPEDVQAAMDTLQETTLAKDGRTDGRMSTLGDRWGHNSLATAAHNGAKLPDKRY